MSRILYIMKLGLDSYTAQSLMDIFEKIVQSNATVLCTVHQPSSRIFLMFHKVIFMKSGRIFYQGTAKELLRWLNSVGFPCPANFNPGDFAMELLQTHTCEQLDALNMFMSTQFSIPDNATASAVGVSVEPVQSEEVSYLSEYDWETATYLTQCRWLIHRETMNVIRNRPALRGRYGVVIFISTLLAIVFFRVGNGNNADAQDFQSLNGAITVLGINAMFASAVPTLLEFPTERPIFIREHGSGMYGAVSYFISKGVLELPQSLLQCILQFLIVFWLMALNGNFVYFVLTAWITALSASSLATVVGAILPDPKQAMQAAPMLFTPQMLFAGFFIPISDIPSWLSWVQYICGLKYGLNLFIINEFSLSLSSCQGDAEQNCRQLLSDNDIDPDTWYYNVFILVAIYMLFRVAACIVLARRGG
jgi:ABC-type multidrug transport system permease subunit